jgi:cobalamin-dependent methionine synthase I
MLNYFERKETDSQRNLWYFPANQVNDIELTDENGKALQTFLTLRQQSQKTKERKILLYLILLLKTMEKQIIWVLLL